MRKLMMGFALAVQAACGAAVSSAPARVLLHPETSYLWSVAPAEAFMLRWEAPADATASLRVVGRGVDRTYSDLAGGALELSFPAAGKATDENVYDLTLTLSDGTVRTARLATVCGLGAGDAAVSASLRDAANVTAWPKFVNKAVLPIPQGTESFTINGVAAETGLNGAAGWYLFAPPGTNAVYTLCADAMTAQVRCCPSGLLLVIR